MVWCSTGVVPEWWPNMGGPMYNRAEETPLRAHKLTWQLPDKGGSLLRAQRRLTRRPRRKGITLKHGPLAAGGEHMLEFALCCLNHLPQGHVRIRDAKKVNPPGQDHSGGACFQPGCVEAPGGE